MKDTFLGNKLKASLMACDDEDRKRSIDSDEEMEEQTHCATYQHILRYLDEASWIQLILIF